MQYLLLAVVFACVSMQASALVVEPPKESAPSTKSAASRNVSTPTKVRLPPPSKATMGFYQAAASDNYDMMELHLQQGADINCRNCDSEGKTPLNRALSRSYGLSYQLIRWLIDHGADVNIADANGRTPLMLSIPVSINGITTQLWIGSDTYGIGQLMKLLLDNGATATVKDIYGNSSLAYMPVFSNGGNDSNQIKARHSAFKLVLTSLLEHSADINATTNTGDTVLIGAAKNCADFSVETLLVNKADPTVKNKLGQTALDIAIEQATRNGQNSSCNNTVKILQNPQQLQQVFSVRPNSQGGSPSGVAPSTSQNTNISTYAGNYSGNYGGDDNGSFQVTVEQDGNIKLIGKSQRNNQTFTGSGKMNSDGSLGISLGSISTGATFQGSINPKTGVLYGTWKNGEQAGNFSGNKQTSQTQAANPIEAIGGLLNVLNKALAK